MQRSTELSKPRRASTGPPRPSSQEKPEPQPDLGTAPPDALAGQLPMKPGAPEVVRSRHLRIGIDAGTGKPGVEFASRAAQAQSKEVKDALCQRLAQTGDAARPGKAWTAANALLELFGQFRIRPVLCVALINDDTLWHALTHAKPDAFRCLAGHPLLPGRVTPSAPIDRRSLAALIATLLRLDETGLASQLLEACPTDADRQAVVRRLLEDDRQPLHHIKAGDPHKVFDAAFDDMLKQRTDPYDGLRPAITAVRERWRVEEPTSRPIEAIQAELAEKGLWIRLDGAGEGHVILGKHTTPEPEVLNLLLDYLQLALKSDATAGLAVDVLFNALSGFGLFCGNGKSAYLKDQGQITDFRQQCRALKEEQILALTAFTRRACTLLFATGQATAIESLIQLSLWLKDPQIRTDPGYQAAALQAVVQHGLAGLWLKTQDYNPWEVSTTLVPALLNCLRQIESPEAALQFIADCLQFLEELQKRMGLTHDGPQKTPWTAARDGLLDGLVHAVAPLVKRSAQGPSLEGETLAQWAWSTAAALELMRDNGESHGHGTADRLYHAPSLTYFHVQGEPFALTLKLLGCDTSLLHTFAVSLERMRDLFNLCPVDIQSVVLRWSVVSLWTPLLLGRPIAAHEVLSAKALLPEVKLHVLQDLLERQLLLPTGLAAVLSQLLDQTGFEQLVGLLKTRPEMSHLAWETLLDLCERADVPANWRRGLPALLRWAQQTVDPASPEEMQRLFALLARCLRRLRQAPKAEDQDLRDMGAELVLSTTPEMAKLQLNTLIAEVVDPHIAAPLLQGWIRECIARFRQRRAPPSPAERRLLKTVLTRYRELLAELTDSEQQRRLEDEWRYFDRSAST